MTNVVWYSSDKGASKVHSASQVRRKDVAAGAFPLDCGKYAPDAFEVHHISWTGRPVTCRNCVKAQQSAPRPRKDAEQGRLGEVGWQRVSEYSGDMIGMPRMHLTRGGTYTCCGIKIPYIGTETREYRIDELIATSRECERCYTEERRDEMRTQR